MGIFSLSSCEGCLVQLLNMEELLEVLNNVDLVDCRLLGVKKNYEKLNIAIVEGAVMSDEEERELKEIRERADILIALGDCACNGSKFLVKDFNINEIKLNLSRRLNVFKSHPLDKFVKVDYYIYGCPIDQEDALTAFKDILMGKEYRPVSYNVCAECILKENACLLDKGIQCLGPITRGGCRATCPSAGRECIGCRGLAEDSNIDSLIEIYKRKGIEVPNYLRDLRGMK